MRQLPLWVRRTVNEANKIQPQGLMFLILVLALSAVSLVGGRFL
jgi:hypothetical protein